MSKPTKYQKWWMGLVLEGHELTTNGLMHNLINQYMFKINQRSVDNSVKRELVEFKDRGDSVFLADLTPAGRKALAE